jgi:formylglycine-generating enzyme required for sulfatase activity
MTDHRTLAIAAVALAVLAVPIAFHFVARTQAPPVTLACNIPDGDARHPGMVWVPGGTFQIGSNFYPEEIPPHPVTVQGFWMDRTEVTNRDFSEFVAATAYVTVAERDGKKGSAVFVMPPPEANLSDVSSWWRYVEGANWRHPGGPETSVDGRDHFPVVAIAYEDALAYAKWKGRALPNEAQWERAARAGAEAVPDKEQPRDANTWQGVFPRIDTSADGFEGIAPVGCFKANAFGLYDMIGNVWELTSDVFEGNTPPARVIKGGSFLCAKNFCMRYRPAARQPQEEDLGTNHVGFRTILVAPGP